MSWGVTEKRLVGFRRTKAGRLAADELIGELTLLWQAADSLAQRGRPSVLATEVDRSMEMNWQRAAEKLVQFLARRGVAALEAALFVASLPGCMAVSAVVARMLDERVSAWKYRDAGGSYLEKWHLDLEAARPLVEAVI